MTIKYLRVKEGNGAGMKVLSVMDEERNKYYFHPDIRQGEAVPANKAEYLLKTYGFLEEVVQLTESQKKHVEETRTGILSDIKDKYGAPLEELIKGKKK